MSPSAPPIWAMGLMSGTSIDGIDVALLQTDGVEITRFGPARTIPYDPGLRERIRNVLGQRTVDAAAACEITRRHADAVQAVFREYPEFVDRVSVIGFHGHTIAHIPEEGMTLQIGDGEQLAALTGMDVVCDFRSADVAAGGQGAPLAPLFHRALCRSMARPVALLNIGGVANVTWIPEQPCREPVAFDTGPGNALLDDWIMETTGEACDLDGSFSKSGKVHRTTLEILLGDSYFRKPPPKSLDRQHFGIGAVRGLSVADGAATLARLTCETVALSTEWLPAPPRSWLVTGGGRRNPTLMAGLAALLDAPVIPVERAEWDGDAMEAQAFAFLAVRFLQGLPTSVPSTTGVPHPVCGGRRWRAP